MCLEQEFRKLCLQTIHTHKRLTTLTHDMKLCPLLDPRIMRLEITQSDTFSKHLLSGTCNHLEKTNTGMIIRSKQCIDVLRLYMNNCHNLIYLRKILVL